MGFSCVIKQGKKDITNNEIMSSYLYGLAPSNSEDTDAPNRQEDLRRIVSRCEYGDRLPEAARDAFKELQESVRDNINSLKQNHCNTCTCEETIPKGWSKEACEKVLAIDSSSITYLSGGY